MTTGSNTACAWRRCVSRQIPTSTENLILSKKLSLHKNNSADELERWLDWAAMTGRSAPPAVGQLGIEPPTYPSVVGCITVRPLLDLTVSVLAAARSQVYH